MTFVVKIAEVINAVQIPRTTLVNEWVVQSMIYCNPQVWLKLKALRYEVESSSA